MNLVDASYYLGRLLLKPDEDAFHSLIEAGDPSVEVICTILPACNEEQFKRLIDVLRDVRTDHAREALAELCKQPYSKQWEMAAEGLFYNHPDAALSVLLELLAEASNHERKRKSGLIEEFKSICSSEFHS